MELFQNGTVIAFSAGYSASNNASTSANQLPAGLALRAGQSVTFRFSVMSTPVRPLDLKKHWKERYVQLGGPANYSFLGAQVGSVLHCRV
jgi:hypothetical protein